MKISFIGTGNMGAPVIRAVCAAMGADNVCITNRTAEKADALAKELGCHTIWNNWGAAEIGDYIFLCVKPQILPGVLKEIGSALVQRVGKGHRPCLISIAAGIQIADIRAMLPAEAASLPVIRVMPNLPTGVGKGMLALCHDAADRTEAGSVQAILAQAGRTDVLPEHLMDAFTAVAGCMPAFVFMFLEAAADAGVMAGLPRAQAIEFAAQTILGSAAMVLESGKHPGALKDAVCSPGGSTIAGVSALETCGLRNAVMQAVTASYEKNKELGSK